MLEQAQLPSPALTTSTQMMASANARKPETAHTPTASADPLMKKAVEFEAVFLNEMLQNMFTGLDNGGTFGTEEGSDAWKSMLINEYANTLSQSGNIGIAESVHSQLLQIQETST
ncbi:chemotactic signal-response protein CheL [Pseudovibrio axinellae]|uniref:Chemotactic signal-response protein CheL n=1 Tax=Pseudovibrio axinellae TaxID=989403 RepID=A0A166ANP8_9HYPH|nr:rod-binding protein [Pseudovibrio axinellae]KZL21356.1 chemotactic signal-response protein CheL [Pseudovibrio axinellae]SEQ97295.1 Rod binding protein [Pseudovibrio axinellae]